MARHRYTVAEARQHVGDISQTMFYELVNAGELSTVEIGRGTFLAASELESSEQLRGGDFGLPAAADDGRGSPDDPRVVRRPRPP
jgi:hypothetical protein